MMDPFSRSFLPKLTGKVMDLSHDYYYWEGDFKAIKNKVLKRWKRTTRSSRIYSSIFRKNMQRRVTFVRKLL